MTVRTKVPVVRFDHFHRPDWQAQPAVGVLAMVKAVIGKVMLRRGGHRNYHYAATRACFGWLESGIPKCLWIWESDGIDSR
jgi:hypothetical protein